MRKRRRKYHRRDIKLKINHVDDDLLVTYLNIWNTIKTGRTEVNYFVNSIIRRVCTLLQLLIVQNEDKTFDRKDKVK